MDVLLVGYAGLKGGIELALRYKETLLESLSESYLLSALAQKNYILPEAAVAGKSAVCGLFPLGKGGLYGGLWEMAEETEKSTMKPCGLEIIFQNIPIKQETVEICNALSVNPYYLDSEGAYLLLAESGYALVQSLQREGIAASIIGITTDNNDRVVINGEDRRFMESRYTDSGDKLL